MTYLLSLYGFWYHDPTYLPFGLCILGGENVHLLLIGSSSFSLQATVDHKSINLGASFGFWYKNTQFSVILFGGILYRGEQCGRHSLALDLSAAYNGSIIGASLSCI